MWLNIAMALIAAVMLVLVFLNIASLFRGRDAARKHAEKCGKATTELVQIVEAGRVAEQERSREKCEKVNQQIDEWNTKYSADCAKGKTMPKLNCEF